MSPHHLSAIVALSLLAPKALHADAPPALAKNHSVRIMPVGDSITEGKFTNGGYRKPLYQLLRAGGYTVEFVGKEDNGEPANETGFSTGLPSPAHEGYGSAPVGAFLDGMNLENHQVLPIGTAIANNHPDIALVMLGTNDLIFKQAPEATALLMQRLLEAAFAKDPGLKIFVASIPPLPPGDTRVIPYNALLRQLVARESVLHPIAFADIHSVFGPGDMGADNVHPSEAGYAKMAALWYTVLTGQPVPKS